MRRTVHIGYVLFCWFISSAIYIAALGPWLVPEITTIERIDNLSFATLAIVLAWFLGEPARRQ